MKTNKKLAQLEKKIKEDTGLKYDSGRYYQNPKMVDKALASPERFVLARWDTAYAGEGQPVLNPGQVYLERDRSVAFTVIPFRPLRREWDGQNFYDEVA